MPHVSRITIYPVKSCDGISVHEIEVLPSGALRNDRRFALIDASGKFINAKRTALIHQLRLTVDPVLREFSVSRRDGDQALSGTLADHSELLSDWLSRFFSEEVSIVENDVNGFPDDLDAAGPTFVSVATLQTVAGWYSDLTTDDIRLRFRANIEIDGVESFWEDRLFREDKQPRLFRVGELEFAGTNPCQRCVVPTRNPLTGAVTPNAFAQHFRKQREASLPSWSARNRFDHFYRLTTNTRRIGQEIKTMRVGDSIELIGED